MNVYLQRARSALAAGRPDEAAVHAWNALPMVREDADREELFRLASELNDELLLRELEDRGFGRPLQESAPAPDTPKSKLRYLPVVIVALVIAGAAGSQVPTEEGAPRPSGEAHPSAVSRIVDLNSGVWLVPVGRAESVDVQKLAVELTFRYGVPVGVQPEVPAVLPTAVDGDRLIAEELLSILARSYGATGRATIVGITDYDMRSPSEGHVFSLRSEPHFGIVSTAQLSANVLDRLRGHTRHERTRKLVARNMAFLYFHRPVVQDPKSLTRPKMASIGEIDDLEERL
jgi:hypothetical protein